MSILPSVDVHVVGLIPVAVKVGNGLTVIIPLKLTCGVQAPPEVVTV